MRVFDTAIAAAAALTATSVAAEKFHAHKMEAVGDFHKAAMPKEWKHAKLVRAPDNNSVAGVVDKISRKLSHWMGFNKGSGFIVATAFNDNDCLHPIWETGGNIGECLMAVDEQTGSVYGSLRMEVIEQKGRFSIESNVYAGNSMCMGQATNHENHARVSTKCQHAGHVHVDGADTVRAYQYSWLPFGAPPKIISFGPNSFRGKLEFDTWNRCDEFSFDGDNVMPNITRWTIQQVSSLMNCYPIEGAAQGEPKSYMTQCAEGHNGPGFPQNVFFEDANCKMWMDSWDPMPMMSMCTGSSPTSASAMHPFYNGARLWHSQLLGDMGGEAGLDMCFHAENTGLTDKLRPWNAYKNVKPGFGDDDKDDNGGEGGPGHGPCGCEDEHNWGSNFCSWENDPHGTGGAGGCLSCHDFANADECNNLYTNSGTGGSNAWPGYEMKLVDDCKWRCFHNPGSGPGPSPCSCVDQQNFGSNFCGFENMVNQSVSHGMCVSCDDHHSYESCNGYDGADSGYEDDAKHDCHWRCHHVY